MGDCQIYYLSFDIDFLLTSTISKPAMVMVTMIVFLGNIHAITMHVNVVVALVSMAVYNGE